MSNRGRANEQPNWDVDDDAAPPVWNDQTSLHAGHDDAADAELPAWSPGRGDAAESISAESPIRRHGYAGTERRQPPAWPNLRDSLRGSGSSAGTPPRTRSRTPSSRAESARLPDTTTILPESDHFDDPDSLLPDFDDVAYRDDQPSEIARSGAYRTRPGYARQRPRRGGTPAPRQSIQLPPVLGAVIAAQDRAVLIGLGGSAFSLFLMIAALSSRSDELPSWIPIHLNAAGTPDQWGTPSTLWRIPLMIAMLTLGGLLTAVFVTRRDPFAARFLVAGAMLVHVLAWIGMIRLLW